MTWRTAPTEIDAPGDKKEDYVHDNHPSPEKTINLLFLYYYILRFSGGGGGCAHTSGQEALFPAPTLRRCFCFRNFIRYRRNCN